MRIAFFGYHKSFDFDKIGGTNSLVRRISLELVKDHNITVDYVIYGTSSEKIENNSGITSNYFNKLKEALNSLKNYDHVVTMYIPPGDFINYALFRRKEKNNIFFHIIYTDWPRSFIKRNAFFIFNSLWRYNGKSFSISPRIKDALKKWGDESVFLLPPVPLDYFMEIGNNKNLGNLRVTFIGRVDVGKGVLEVIDILNQLAQDENIILKFYGIHWEDDPEAVKIHKNLSSQNKFDYISLDFNHYSSEVEEMVQDILRETDIFLQPYRHLSSSIDMPLLILEAMASLCAVITRPYGDIPRIYGESVCLVDDEEGSEKIVEIIRRASQWIPMELERINHQNKTFSFDTLTVTTIFLKSLLEVGGKIS
ncbi:MAG: glycosyltransferase [Methanobacterium sp. Maddingley MBC34]|nr:MAG: glycosyltransferase [Methanobacterium sp. Maddingley MBC34]